MDDWEDLGFCRLTVIITCSCTRCLPDVPVFIFWSDGKASVELSWSWKHSYARAVLSGEWFMVAGGARGPGPGRTERCGEVRCSGRERVFSLSVAPYGHRVSGARGLPAAAPGASTLARPLQALAGPPSVRQDIPPLPCTTHSTAAQTRAAGHCLCGARGERSWGQGCQSPGTPALRFLLALPFSPTERCGPGETSLCPVPDGWWTKYCSVQELSETSLQEEESFLPSALPTPVPLRKVGCSPPSVLSELETSLGIECADGRSTVSGPSDC